MINIIRKYFWMIKNGNKLLRSWEFMPLGSLQVKVISACVLYLSFSMILNLPYIKPLGDSTFKRENY